MDDPDRLLVVGGDEEGRSRALLADFAPLVTDVPVERAFGKVGHRRNIPRQRIPFHLVPITEDQRAMLQLLLEGGQSYADIGSLLGIDAGEVRSRARTSLTEIGGADPDAKVGLTDYLLGQADPIGRADAARQLQHDPESAALAAKLSSQLRLLAPNARLPELPGAPAAPAPGAAPSFGGTAEPGGASAAAARSGAAARKGLDTLGRGVRGLGSKNRRLPVVLAAGGLAVLIAVLLITGVVGGGDDDSSTTDTSTTASNGDLTIVELQPVDDSGASGQAVFVQAKDQPAVQLNLAGLQPSSNGDAYVVWFYNPPSGGNPEVAIPFAFQVADKDGNLTGAAPIPSSLLSALPAIQGIRVSRVSREDEKTLSSFTTKKSKSPPPYVGETVLEGAIPRTGTTATTPAQ